MEFRIPKHSWNLFVQDLGISNDHGEIWHIVKMQNDVKWDIQQQIMVLNLFNGFCWFWRRCSLRSNPCTINIQGPFSKWSLFMNTFWSILQNILFCANIFLTYRSKMCEVFNWIKSPKLLLISVLSYIRNNQITPENLVTSILPCTFSDELIYYWAEIVLCTIGLIDMPWNSFWNLFLSWIYLRNTH